MDYSSLIFSKPNVIVLFYQDWCGACQMFKPVFEKLTKELKKKVGDKLLVVFIKGDDNPELLNQQKIVGVPTVKFYQNGKLITEFSGGDISKLKEIINAVYNY